MAKAVDCIFLTGAPESALLDWDQSTLLSEFGTPTKRFLGEARASRPPPTTSQHLPKWRVITRTTDVSGDANADIPRTQFLSFDNVQPERLRDEHLRFLEHSLAVINDLDSSQIAPPDTTALDDSTFITSVSFATSLTDTSLGTSDVSLLSGSPTKTRSTHEDTMARQTGITASFTDLKRIPNAEHINHILPQTMTVNLIAAVISVSPTRTVQLRKRKAEMDIAEVIVGDDTRAGFSISFWLVPADSQQKPTDDLRETLRLLRAGVVVVLQNVALSAFKGCVYGQSLSRKFAKNSTSITVMLGADGLPAPVKAKFDRVSTWRDHFVGKTTILAKSGGQGPRHKGLGPGALPPDTQSQQ